MGLLDRSGGDTSGEGDAEPPGGAEPEQPTESAPATETPTAEEPSSPNYVEYDREHPPALVEENFGNRGGEVDEEVLDLLDHYVRDDGRIREDVLSLPVDALREWADVETAVGGAKSLGNQLTGIVEERTVEVSEELPEDEFFQTADGFQTLTNRYDLERAVPFEKKLHFQERDRYWVNKPYSFVVIFHSTKENETKYYLIEPYLTPIEEDVVEFLSQKLRAAIKYETDDVLAGEDEDDENVRANVIERETRRLLKRFDLYSDGSGIVSSGGLRQRLSPLANKVGVDIDAEGDEPSQLDGIAARPEPVLLEEDSTKLTEYQVEKILYYLKRDFVGYERIDGIKHDINVEDISCDGYNSPVFVYHTDHENIISNVYHGEDELDNFVVKLAQRSGKGISKRTPQVDATLPDGSRAQLTLGREVSDHGTNYTIRQFKDVPFTPIDLINWRTFSLDQMAFLWLAIENEKSLIFAGGTASGKTTSLNAVSLFIPSNSKIVSIEDTREVELPQRNWIASVTRPSFSDDDKGDIDEFDLLEAALRQRPDYIVMGEIRGEEGRTLFQVMSTGHTTYTTFHADSVGEVLKRFTTEPISVSKTLFTALDLVSIQRQTRVQGRKVRRSSSITEINDYSAENDEINVRDVYQWLAEDDEFERLGNSNLIEQIMFDRGWSREEYETELEKRRVVLAYLIDHGLNSYAQVAASLQAFMSDPDTLLTLVAHDALKASLEDLREMESVLIDIDPEKEALVPRPDPPTDVAQEASDILESAEYGLLDDHRGAIPVDGAIERMLRKAAEESEAVDTAAIERAVETAAEKHEAQAEPTSIGNAEDDEAAVEEDAVEDPALFEAEEPVAEADTEPFVNADGGQQLAGEDGKPNELGDLFEAEDAPGGESADGSEDAE